MIYYNILESLPLAVYCKSIDDEGRYEFCNQRLLQLFDFAVEDVIGKTDSDLFSAKQVEKFRVAEALALIEGHPGGSTEETFVNKSGKTIWVRARRYVVFDQHDSSRKLVGIFEDISELVNAREEAHAHQQRIDTISNNVPGFLYQFKLSVDGAMSFTYMNSYGAELFEADPVLLQENPALIFDMVLSEDRAEFDRILHQALSQGAPWRWEGKLRTPKGTLRVIRGASEPTRLESGDILWDGILFDISREAQAEQMLTLQREHVNKAARLAALGAIAGGIAHEINTPLSIIAISTELLRRYATVESESADAERRDKAIGSIEKASDKISSIVQTMRGLCRPDRTHERSLFNLKKLISDVILVSKFRLTHLGIGIDLSAISDEIEILGNPQQITQVFLNLINNSCDALSSGVPNWIRIDVECGNSGDLKVLFTDSGDGIPTEISERFFLSSSLLSTKSEEEDGTGLGLGVSQGIMVGHGGSIMYNKECPNTQFILFFPNTSVVRSLERVVS